MSQGVSEVSEGVSEVSEGVSEVNERANTRMSECANERSARAKSSVERGNKVSKQASEQVSAAERASEASRAEQAQRVSGASEHTSEWPSTYVWVLGGSGPL